MYIIKPIQNQAIAWKQKGKKLKRIAGRVEPEEGRKKNTSHSFIVRVSEKKLIIGPVNRFKEVISKKLWRKNTTVISVWCQEPWHVLRSQMSSHIKHFRATPWDASSFLKEVGRKNSKKPVEGI